MICVTCSKLITKTLERCSTAFIVYFEHIAPFSSVAIVDFEQANVPNLLILPGPNLLILQALKSVTNTAAIINGCLKIFTEIAAHKKGL